MLIKRIVFALLLWRSFLLVGYALDLHNFKNFILNGSSAHTASNELTITFSPTIPVNDRVCICAQSVTAQAYSSYEQDRTCGSTAVGNPLSFNESSIAASETSGGQGAQFQSKVSIPWVVAFISSVNGGQLNPNYCVKVSFTDGDSQTESVDFTLTSVQDHMILISPDAFTFSTQNITTSAVNCSGVCV